MNRRFTLIGAVVLGVAIASSALAAGKKNGFETITISKLVAAPSSIQKLAPAAPLR